MHLVLRCGLHPGSVCPFLARLPALPALGLSAEPRQLALEAHTLQFFAVALVFCPDCLFLHLQAHTLQLHGAPLVEVRFLAGPAELFLHRVRLRGAPTGGDESKPPPVPLEFSLDFGPQPTSTVVAPLPGDLDVGLAPNCSWRSLYWASSSNLLMMASFAASWRDCTTAKYGTAVAMRSSLNRGSCEPPEDAPAPKLALGEVGTEPARCTVSASRAATKAETGSVRGSYVKA